MIRAKDIVRHELVGLKVKVIRSSNSSQVGITGTVVDESRQTLTIETEKGTKSVAKDQCVFSFLLPSGKWVSVEGKLIVARPEDRIKKKQRKY